MTKPKEACLFQSALVRSPSTPDCGGRGEGVLGPEGVFVCVHVCVDQLPRMASNSYLQASGSWFSVSGKHIFGLPISWTLRRVTIFKQVSKTIAYKCWLSHNICWTTVWKNKNTNTSITVILFAKWAADVSMTREPNRAGGHRRRRGGPRAAPPGRRRSRPREDRRPGRASRGPLPEIHRRWGALAFFCSFSTKLSKFN